MKAFTYTPEYLARNRKIVKMFQSGMKKAEIARRMGLCRERVAQIIKAAS
jgi:DNA-binding transcriptional regulator LsrR (DeoR family)